MGLHIISEAGVSVGKKSQQLNVPNSAPSMKIELFGTR